MRSTVGRGTAMTKPMTGRRTGAERMTPSFSELFRVFGRIGLLSFGGPAAQISLMHEELVDRPQVVERAAIPRRLVLLHVCCQGQRRCNWPPLLAGACVGSRVVCWRVLLFVVAWRSGDPRPGAWLCQLWRGAAGSGAVRRRKGPPLWRSYCKRSSNFPARR